MCYLLLLHLVTFLLYYITTFITIIYIFANSMTHHSDFINNYN